MIKPSTSTVCDEAVLDNREYSMRFEQHGYQTLSFVQGALGALLDNKMHDLPNWAELSIEVEEQNIGLFGRKDDKKIKGRAGGSP